MIPAPFDYLRPASLEEALAALADPEAKALAGGQSLIPLLKLRVLRPSLLVDVAGLGLRGVAAADARVEIGALATWDDVARAPALAAPGLAALPECAAGIGDLQVRNRGTAGGSLAHADPASDLAPVLLALGASAVVRSAAGERTLPLPELLVGPFLTGLAPGELLVRVDVPLPPPGAGSAYVAVEHPASGFALAGAAALALPDGTARVALTGVGAAPALLPAGDPLQAVEEVEVLGDRFAPADYRRQLARVVVR
ncbi:MAG TPA: FAD binding domain-containing protein, partial [Gaiellaceae bacterium]|nr:FAD binding domain-containing protein [Gaiellaceae bacterium]